MRPLDLAVTVQTIALGPPGRQGIQGLQGRQGNRGLQGIQGLKGDPGRQVLFSYGAPNPGLGSNGDIAIDVTNKRIYPPKANNEWAAEGVFFGALPPQHQWSGTALAFYNADGSLGEAINLKGDTGDTGPAPGHLWSGTALAFYNADGTLGNAVNLRGLKGDTGDVTPAAEAAREAAENHAETAEGAAVEALSYRDQAALIVGGDGTLRNPTSANTQSGEIMVADGPTGLLLQGSGIKITDIITSNYVVTPRNVAPVAGATGLGANENPITFTLTDYMNLGGVAVGSREFRIATDAAMTNVVKSSGAIAGAGASYVLSNLSGLIPSTTHYWQGRYTDANGKVSDWSNPTGFVTASKLTVDIGDAYAGGYYGALVEYGGQRYRLVVSPKASGEVENTLQWKTSTTTTSGTFSEIDGKANTALMVGAEHPAAEFCRNLNIGGFNDWYLPASKELSSIFEKLKPNTDANSTTTGINPYSVPPRANNYAANDPAVTPLSLFKYPSGAQRLGTLFLWSSTQMSASTAGMIYLISANNAGNVVGSSKTGGNTFGYAVRAIRRVPVAA